MFSVIMLCVFGTTREIPHLRESSDSDALTPAVFRSDFMDVFNNRSFRLIFIGMLMPTFAIADEVALKTGKRRERTIYAECSFANKASAALGAMVGGVMLDVIAFPRAAEVGSVAADTTWWLGVIEGPASSIVSISGVAFYLRYRINRKHHAEIRAAIDKRNQS
ncbi:MAG: MFS transporter [Pseudomonadales bacterium]|jgi:hypothetical protein|nr:hypothetical protein [Acidiferrobacteraceae bacterium]MDP6375464.1 MFS transporter [Pseudomonadales bacterium]MDP6470631.1 MFS transporter [Pseudomonadales bacterium]MDP6828513.1 MFS transporter [Pseudomonadales bacterium]MDP6970502.1 MFS transporter [Pseudomonadales bacterium]|tara:strand:+ start:1799 stop:2290 length:492 start_codon:yes stop_codon:yes gene_type:complete